MSLRSDILVLFPEAKEQNGYMRIRCPYHKGGQERHASLSILLQDKGELKAGFAKCFTCGWVGNFKNLAQDMGYEYVPDTYTLAVTNSPVQHIIRAEQAVYKKDTPYRYSSYLESRGIDEATQQKFKTYQKDEEQKIYMPVFSKTEKFLYANARSISSKMFFVQSGAVKSLAGIELVDFSKPIAICESQIDAMTFYSAKFCRAVSTLGVTNIASLEQIKSAVGPFFLAFDSDEAGNRAAKEAADYLGAYRCKRINFKEFKDANNLWQAVNFNEQLFSEFIEENMK